MGGGRGMDKQRLLLAVPLLVLVIVGIAFVRQPRAEKSLRDSLARAAHDTKVLEAAVAAARTQVDQQKTTAQRAPAWQQDISTNMVLTAGDALGSYRIMSIPEAVQVCRLTNGCEGFTYQSHTGGVNPDIAKVFFKAAYNAIPAKGWYAYKNPGRHAHELSIDPGYELYLQHKHLITAEFDVEPIAKYGHQGALAQWPEYRVDPEDKPAFRYPRPGKDRIAVSVSPMVYFIPQLITSDIADGMIDAARAQLQRSQVARTQDEKNKDGTDNVRTSSGAWLTDANPHAKALRDRIQEITGIPRSSFEQLQILRYEEGQKYGSHVDYFHPKYYGDGPSNRVATLITYLTTVTEGGATVFPHAMGSSVPSHANRVDCTSGVRVAPLKGSGVLFYSMRPDYAMDTASTHGGCPVGHGQHKWVAVQWLRIDMPDGHHPPISRVE